VTPHACTGFVMGHNMLDEYWDTNGHGFRRCNDPCFGRNGARPRQDFSSRITGPMLGALGRANLLPGITRDQHVEDTEAELKRARLTEAQARVQQTLPTIIVRGPDAACCKNSRAFRPTRLPKRRGRWWRMRRSRGRCEVAMHEPSPVIPA